MLAAAPLPMPVLAVGAGTGDFTATAMRQVATAVRTARLAGVGHYAALEGPDQLADAVLAFYHDIDQSVDVQ